MSGGWGTLVGVRLEILVLADPDQASAAERLVRALAAHSVTVLSERRGALSSHVTAAKIAREIQPALVHGIGARGYGAAAPPIARGIGAKLVVSLSDLDLATVKPKKLAKLANGADAVILSSEALVEPLRTGGLKRSVYIVSDEEARRPLEVIYGRLVERELGDAGGECDLVQIGPSSDQ